MTLNKVDLWDQRYDRQGHRPHTLAELRALVPEHAGTEQGRRVRRLSIRSLVGNTCRVAHPWPGEQVRAGEPVAVDVKDGIIAFGTEPDAVYEFHCPAAITEAPDAPRPDQTDEPLRYNGPAYVGDVPPARRIDVWLGLPTR